VSPEERIEQLEAENAALRQQVEKLLREIEEWKRGFRERGKRRSSRTEGRERRESKKPGRKLGHAAAHRRVPEQIDQEVVHATPTVCSCCTGPVGLTEETVSTLEMDIPEVRPKVTRHTTVVGRCAQCKARVISPLPGASRNGTTVAPIVFGPNLQSVVLSMRYEVKASLGAIGAFMGQWLGVEVSQGGLFRMCRRLQTRSASAIDEIQKGLRNAPVVGIDETGFRQNGLPGWCWVARTDTLSFYKVDMSRGRHVAEDIVGPAFAGVLVSDFYSVYADQGTWINGFCGAHLIRDAKKIAELAPCPQTEQFRDRLRTFYAEGEAAAQSGNVAARHGARIRLGRLASSTDYVGFADIVNLQERIGQRWEGITRFLDNPAVPWHNNATERDIRPVGRYRAVAAGTRSPCGSLVFGHWMSVLGTRRKNKLPLSPYIAAINHAYRYGHSPPSVFT
jgi:transposase